jgi:hypothetical protein
VPLPNLFIIGAQKCGTSSLHHYLGLHPEIGMSPSKELNFFSHERVWRLGRAWYEQQFPEAPVRGEGSPSYSEFPFFPFVPERIKAYSPDARFVYLVRDPIERFIGGWHFEYCYGKDRRPFAELVERLDDNIHVARSSYATQLERYLAHFEENRILVVDQHDLRHDRTATLRRIFRLVDVDDRFTSPRLDVEENVLEQARWLTPAGRRIESMLLPLLGRSGMRRLRALVPVRLSWLEREPEPRPVVEGELRERLLERLAPEADRLRALTGLRFESWSF